MPEPLQSLDSHIADLGARIDRQLKSLPPKTFFPPPRRRSETIEPLTAGQVMLELDRDAERLHQLFRGRRIYLLVFHDLFLIYLLWLIMKGTWYVLWEVGKAFAQHDLILALRKKVCREAQRAS